MSKMITCKTCGEDIAKSAKSCPKCGAKNKKPFYKRGWFIFIVIITIIGALGAVGSNSTKTTDTTVSTNNTNVTSSTDKKEVKEPEKPKAKYEIVGEITNTRDSMGVYLVGTLKNNSGREASYVQISFNLFDKDGNQVGTALANTNNLANNGTWKFKAMGIDTDGKVASYKVANITGF